MTPLQTLSIELGPQVAEAALQALMNEAERVREGRATVMVIITFEAEKYPEWVKAIRTDSSGRYEAIHHSGEGE